MERNYSVDDIVGTLWNSSELGIGVQSGVPGHGGENEYGPHGLNRSASVFAFDEFIKHHHNYREPAPNGVETHVPAEDEAEDDKKSEVVEDNSQLTTEPKLKDSPTDTTAAKVDDLESRWSPSEHKGAAVSPFQEPEIKAALNPLFAGLHNDMKPTSAGNDPEETYSYFKKKLDEACLQARQLREGAIGLPDNVLDHFLEHAHKIPANGAKSGKFGAAEGLVNILAASGGLGAPTSKQVTSGSSPDQSDEDDGDTEQTLGPGDKKRVKRMLSNRESARRSRRRKQAHLNELESQVAQLRVQNSSLLENLHNISEKLKDTSKDNLQLKTYVELLKARLAVALPIHRQLTMAGSNGQSHVLSPQSTLDTQEFAAASHGFGWESVHHGLQRSTFRIPPPPPMTASAMGQINAPQLAMDHSIPRTVQQGMKMSRPHSMQRVSSTDHLKKRIRNAGVACSPTSWGATGLDLEGSSVISQFSLSSDY